MIYMEEWFVKEWFVIIDSSSYVMYFSTFDMILSHSLMQKFSFRFNESYEFSNCLALFYVYNYLHIISMSLLWLFMLR